MISLKDLDALETLARHGASDATPEELLSLISAIRKMREGLNFYASAWGSSFPYDHDTNLLIQKELNRSGQTARQVLEEVFGE